MKAAQWWQQEWDLCLSDALAHINEAGVRDNPVDRLRDLCNALNKAWNAYYGYRKTHSQLTKSEKEASHRGATPPDNQAFEQLLLTGLGDEGKVGFCRSSALRSLADFTPQVMNHATLRRRDYHPANISERLRREAAEEHRELKSADERYAKDPTDGQLRQALLKKAAHLLYVIRSNTEHGEKTPKGPDLEKAKRDREVAGTACAAIEQIFAWLFIEPETRLAVYGTLLPGRVNASMLAELEGSWQDAVVKGEIEERGGLPIFRWCIPGAEVHAKVFTSPALPNHLQRIDRSEGANYRRILVPARTPDGIIVASIYAGNPLT